jgi:hypothetical protein
VSDQDVIVCPASTALRRWLRAAIDAAKWPTGALQRPGPVREALSAAEEAVEYTGSLTEAGWAMAEMIETAVRTEQPGRAAGAMRYLSQVASATAPTGHSVSGRARWRC